MFTINNNNKFIYFANDDHYVPGSDDEHLCHSIAIPIQYCKCPLLQTLWQNYKVWVTLKYTHTYFVDSVHFFLAKFSQHVFNLKMNKYAIKKFSSSSEGAVGFFFTLYQMKKKTCRNTLTWVGAIGKSYYMHLPPLLLRFRWLLQLRCNYTILLLSFRLSVYIFIKTTAFKKL